RNKAQKITIPSSTLILVISHDPGLKNLFIATIMGRAVQPWVGKSTHCTLPTSPILPVAQTPAKAPKSFPRPAHPYPFKLSLQIHSVLFTIHEHWRTHATCVYWATVLSVYFAAICAGSSASGSG